ncbi:hypothetical protein [Shewanella litorisediminis]|uniref:YggT family protein n=1 Tax=Shewanella litorisediminis TaxID=1173586 RepID=A0ABX7G721_9GAMM|nr:hypothetical protein [Shewanella litorisediminis]MCL2916756.1 hypothetical protein [Shewanella litorisediminis]QRH03075.1 hypothetical protein JQC75_06620 [Shewanella litorisediminis]
MLDEVIGSAFKVVARFIVEVFVEIIFEIMIKGPGYLLVKPFSKSAPDPDGVLVVIVGLVFWAFLITLGITVFL